MIIDRLRALLRELSPSQLSATCTKHLENSKSSAQSIAFVRSLDDQRCAENQISLSSTEQFLIKDSISASDINYIELISISEQESFAFREHVVKFIKYFR